MFLIELLIALLAGVTFVFSKEIFLILISVLGCIVFRIFSLKFVIIAVIILFLVLISKR